MCESVEHLLDRLFFVGKYLLSCDFWCWEAFVAKAKAKAKKKTTGARAKRDRRRKLATEAPAPAEELLASVPGLDALQDVPAFDDLPVDEAQQAAFDDFCAHAEEPEQMQLGAVVRLDHKQNANNTILLFILLFQCLLIISRLYRASIVKTEIGRAHV